MLGSVDKLLPIYLVIWVFVKRDETEEEQRRSKKKKTHQIRMDIGRNLFLFSVIKIQAKRRHWSVTDISLFEMFCCIQNPICPIDTSFRPSFNTDQPLLEDIVLYSCRYPLFRYWLQNCYRWLTPFKCIYVCIGWLWSVHIYDSLTVWRHITV